MDKEHTIRQYDFNLKFAEKLVEDLDPHQMTCIPAVGLENHPAFTLGHLCSGSAMLCEDLGSLSELPSGWSALFTRTGPGDPRLPDPDSSKYPARAELLAQLALQHDRVKKLFRAADASMLEQNVGWRFGIYMPSLSDLVIFMCISHESMHLGQLSAWRRAMKLPSAIRNL